MAKVTVTKEQMDTIEKIKANSRTNLQSVLKFATEGLYSRNGFKSMNDMTAEQIVLAWHGYVEVETEFVSFDQAMQAGKKGKDIILHWENDKYRITSQYLIESCLRNLSVCDHGLLDLVDGKFTIEGDK